MARRVGSVLLATGIAAVSGFEALAGMFWGFGLKCDDSCSNGPAWRDDPDSWQWQALGWVGIAGFVSAVLFLAAVALRWRWLALATLALWAFLAVRFLILLDESGLTSNAERGWTAIAALLVAGLAAVALAGPRARTDG